MEVGSRFSLSNCKGSARKPFLGISATCPHARKQNDAISNMARRCCNAFSQRAERFLVHAVAYPERPDMQRTRAAALTPAETVESIPTQNGDISKEEQPEVEGIARVPVEKVILIQAFGWDSCGKKDWYRQIQDQLPLLKGKGFNGMWLPPPSQSVSCQGYLPGQLYNLNSKYGSKEHLIELNRELKKLDISPIADVVINHRCADAQDENGVWNNFRDDVTHKGEKINWGTWAITSNDPDFGGTGNPDTGADYGPAPDLDHANPKLRNALKEWLRFLREDIGFEGWRFDFVKGYAPTFVTEYVNETLPAKSFCVAEYWVDCVWDGKNLEYNQDVARQQLCNWLDACKQASCAFDFPMKGILQEAVKNTEYWRLSDPNGKPLG